MDILFFFLLNSIVTVQSQPQKLAFFRCGVSAKYIFTVKRSRMQAFITFNCKNMLGSERLHSIYMHSQHITCILQVLCRLISLNHMDNINMMFSVSFSFHSLQMYRPHL